ncbi:unnamed protein product, partial [marine sediment metagenome]
MRYLNEEINESLVASQEPNSEYAIENTRLSKKQIENLFSKGFSEIGERTAPPILKAISYILKFEEIVEGGVESKQYSEIEEEAKRTLGVLGEVRLSSERSS